MTDYELAFCKGIINDKQASKKVIEDVWEELLNTEYSSSVNDKLNFIKTHIKHNDISHIDVLIMAIDGDSVEILEYFDADYDDLQSMKDTRDKWSKSIYADEIEDRIAELEEEYANNEDEEDY